MNTAWRVLRLQTEERPPDTVAGREYVAQEAGWALGPVWTGAKSLAPTGTFLSFCSLFVLYTHFFVLTVLAFVSCAYSTTHTTQTSTPPAGFEPAIPVSDRPQILALDRSATGIGGIRSPYRSACSESLYRLRSPGPHTAMIGKQLDNDKEKTTDMRNLGTHLHTVRCKQIRREYVITGANICRLK